MGFSKSNFVKDMIASDSSSTIRHFLAIVKFWALLNDFTRQEEYRVGLFSVFFFILWIYAFYTLANRSNKFSFLLFFRFCLFFLFFFPFFSFFFLFFIHSQFLEHINMEKKILNFWVFYLYILISTVIVRIAFSIRVLMRKFNSENSSALSQFPRSRNWEWSIPPILGDMIFIYIYIF